MQEIDEIAPAGRQRVRRGTATERSAGLESERPATPRKLVLVVEDDRDLRDAIVLLLEHEGYDVVFAPDGKAALDLLRQGVVPGAIVLDLMMPVMSGWDFRRHQLADPALASIPVIVLSADPGAARLAGSPGVRDLLWKPVDVESLLGSLERVWAN
jgi:CheY-like chemotaxis protein